METKTIFKCIFSDDYQLKNPEIAEPNVFSSSTLARSTEEQFYWKTHRGEAEKHELNFFMQIGSAEHEFIQKRLPPTFIAEYKFILTIPFTWKNAPELRDIRVLGHIDAIDFSNKELIDIKTTWSKNDYSDTYRRQVGFYKHWCNEKFGNHWRAEIHKVKLRLKTELWAEDDFARIVDIVVEKMEVDNDQADRAYAEVYMRALECARRMDEWFGLQKKAINTASTQQVSKSNA